MNQQRFVVMALALVLLALSACGVAEGPVDYAGESPNLKSLEATPGGAPAFED
jgi:hypothetical protein